MTAITSKEIKELNAQSKLKFIGSNEFQVNNQGTYRINKDGIFKQQNSASKVVFHKIANFINSGQYANGGNLGFCYSIGGL
jgi:hypothetical protein